MSNKAIDLHYEASGTGPGLVLLHGLYGSGNNWRRYARRWASQWRVLLPDLRNHGRSPHSNYMDYPTMAADVVRLLEREAIDQALILGHSMGGKTAMAMALNHPERVRGLIIADMAPIAYGDHGHAAIIEALRQVDLTAVNSRADAERQLVGDIEPPMVRQFLLTNLERSDQGWQWRLPLGVLARALPTIQGWPQLDAVWSRPALFVHGARSEYVTDAGTAAIGRYFPKASIETVPEAGHWLHVEAPDAFTASVEHYLKAARESV